MKQDLSDKRKVYFKNNIEFKNIDKNPFLMFDLWYNHAVDSGKIEEPNAMSLSTIDQSGYPRTRIVLLKEYNAEGFIFYTNYNSQKGNAIADFPKVCLSFFWHDLEQQIIIKGNAYKVPGEMSDEYFRKRPFESRIGAIISQQSSVIDFHEDLDAKAIELQRQFKEGIVPRPENWGGYIVKPVEFEFWQGRPSRLHDRLRYRLVNDNWIMERLAP